MPVRCWSSSLLILHNRFPSTLWNRHTFTSGREYSFTAQSNHCCTWSVDHTLGSAHTHTWSPESFRLIRLYMTDVLVTVCVTCRYNNSAFIGAHGWYMFVLHVVIEGHWNIWTRRDFSFTYITICRTSAHTHTHHLWVTHNTIGQIFLE